jgi:myo-inositol catabolism protein IolC
MTPLYMLAFDHRSSFSRDLLGIAGTPTPFEARRVADVKAVVYEGFRLALSNGVPHASAGLLVDEQYGAEIARSARHEGVVLAMPVERSGRAEFEFEFGDDFWSHIEAFDPTYAKVLVRYNPGGDAEVNRRQAERLRTLSSRLRRHGRKLLFELLVPAEPAQLDRVGGSGELYDLELRPGLVVDAVRELQGYGVEPHVWKIEGLDRREDCERVAEQARSAGRDDVTCIVLGRGADDAKVEHWLRQGAPVEGYAGFAIGRTIWWDALKGFLDGNLEREDAAQQVADNYRRFVQIYDEAAKQAAPA